MKLIVRIALTLVLIAATLSRAPAAQPVRTEQVVLAGGCFWGMQAVFASLKGVSETVAGYAGGSAATANYDAVSSETTQHAESVQITFDPRVISFRALLDVYFLVAHDPTELNRQGPDTGTSYRSEIFYTSDAQRAQAQAMIASLTRRHVFHAPIVTKLERLPAFYPAEAYHQNYLVNNPSSPYIVYNDIPKLRALQRRFPQLVNEASAPMRTIAAR
ncbi:MAG TPA: peptide-methionine (S)-S-oxide reductase MsrA [Candidatus Dormibacteraeota bacterium]|nr:peptide-methionine (S)-S-oxide reductase MsrA [Candidatus Dormibacteraeota bacterium]